MLEINQLIELAKNAEEANYDKSRSGEFEKLPDATYTGIIEKVEKNISPKGVEQIVLTYVLTGNGKFDNRKVWHNLMISHSNPKVNQISIGTISRLLKEFGIIEEADSLTQYISTTEDFENLIYNLTDKDIVFTLKTTKNNTTGKEFQNVSYIGAN